MVRFFIFSLVISVALREQVEMQGTCTLKPTPKTVLWGNYDAKAAPAERLSRP